MGFPTRFTSMAVNALTVTTASVTLTVEESGTDVFCNAADLAVTLPKASAFSGMVFSLITNVVSTGAGTTLGSPANGGSIIGMGATTTAGDTLINTGTAGATGDFLTVKSNGTNWYVVQSDGIWV